MSASNDTTIIKTEKAPAAIGTYSQAVQTGNTVYVSGQIPLDPNTMTLVSEDFAEQAHQVFRNLQAIAQAAGGELSDMVKLNVFVLDLANFQTLNEVMSEYFSEPYPARAALGVAQLPKDALVEIDAIMVLG